MPLPAPSNASPAGLLRPVVLAAVVSAAAVGGIAFTTLAPPARVAAVTALAQESFAVCTAPVDSGIEAIFVLDFETGDLTGSVINQNTSRFGIGYRHNVLKDLEFKKVKDPKFLLVPGQANFGGQASGRLAPTALYVTDAATGVTVAYGIPWNSQQVAGGAAPAMQPLMPLDIIRPRGGGTKVR
ncbi:MAG: hypothetical protein FJ286_08690 [Planctomycetes bacterium]|nr:hypothetical protein [Planctomycetota bacterium]